MAQTRTTLMQPVVIAEGITRRLDLIDANRTLYEAVTTIDGQETVIAIRSRARAARYMEQAEADAAEYAADLDMQDAARQAVARLVKARRQASQPVQLAMAF